MEDELVLENRILNGDAVARFLSDPTIQGVMQDQKLLYFNEWVEAESPEARERIWAKARALDDIDTQLRAVVASGQRAKHDLAARDG